MNRGNLTFVGTIVIILGALALAWFLLLPPAHLSVPAGPPRQQTGVSATIAAAAGPVEIRVRDAKWQPARIGDVITPGTELQTEIGGNTELTYGEDLSVSVGADTNVRVDRIDDTLVRLVLGKQGGTVVADLGRDANRQLQVSAEGSDSVTTTRDGRVHVLSDGHGNIQAAVTRGTADVTAAGKTVQLKRNEMTEVGGGAPTKPETIPKSLLLKVRWPAAITSKRRHMVVGTANPGSRIRVGEKIVRADSLGRFKAMVELNEGRNTLQVYAIDVLGRAEKLNSPNIIVDTRAPAHVVKTNPQMWDQGSE